jgi:hypothetical protein
MMGAVMRELAVLERQVVLDRANDDRPQQRERRDAMRILPGQRAVV